MGMGQSCGKDYTYFLKKTGYFQPKIFSTKEFYKIFTIPLIGTVLAL
jgi:hypothetical protein